MSTMAYIINCRPKVLAAKSNSSRYVCSSGGYLISLNLMMIYLTAIDLIDYFFHFLSKYRL